MYVSLSDGILCREQSTFKFQRERMFLDEMSQQKRIDKLLNKLLSQSVSTSLCFIFNQPVRRKHKNKIKKII
jgi:hypothetical protein